MRNRLLKEFQRYINRVSQEILGEDFSVEEYLFFLSEYNLLHLLSDSIKEYSQVEYLKVAASKIMLLNHKKALEKELVELIDYCESKNLEILLLKGFSIKDYDERNIRYFHDIDLAFNPNQLRQLLQYFSVRGFSINSGTNKIDPILIITPINKDYYHIKLDKENISFELHNNLFNRYLGYEFNKEFIWENQGILTIGSKKIHIMEKQKSLLYIMLHFIKDFKYCINENIRGSKKPKMNLLQIFDISNICENTFKTADDWQSFINLAIKHKVLFEIIFVLKIVDSVFPDLVPSELVYKYFKMSIKFENHISTEILDILYNESLISLLKNDFYIKVYTYIQNKNNHTMTIFRDKALFYDSQIKEYSLNYIKKHPKLLYKNNSSKNTDFDLKSTFNCMFNKNCFNFHLSLESQQTIDLSALLVEFKFITPYKQNSNWMLYNYQVKLEEQIPSMYLLDYVTEIKLPSSNYSISVDSVNKNNILIDISFKSEYIEISENNFSKMLFSISINQKTKNNYDLRYSLCEDYWQSLSSNYKLNFC